MALKKYIKSIFVLLGLLVMTACTKSNESSVSPYCAITSFGVNNIITYVSYKTSNDSTVWLKKTIAGSSITFNIDQEAGTIETVQNLPNWINLTKVVPKFTSYGSLYLHNSDSTLFLMTSGSDSLDFSSPRTVTCLSSDGLFTKDYTITFKKNTDVSDTIVWESVASNLELTSSEFRTVVVTDVYADEQGGDSVVSRMFVFYEDESGTPSVTSTTQLSKATTWTTEEALIGSSSAIDFKTVMVHRGDLYALNKSGILCKSTEQEKGVTWTEMGTTTFSNLLSSDGVYLYAYDGVTIKATKDFSTWVDAGKTDLNMLPTSNTYSYSRISYNNDSIIVSMMGGKSPNNTKNGVTWYKTTDLEDPDMDEWMYIGVSDENKFGCPLLNEYSTVYYYDDLYMMGRNSDNKFAGIYRSQDNGISWHLQTTKWMLPAALDGANGMAGMLRVDDTLYVIQQGGKVWRGTIK